MAEEKRDETREKKLKTVLFREEQAARNWQDADLTSHRQASLDYYERNQRAFPSEDGQSKVITSEYLDTVESIMPALMRVFALGDSIVNFTPDNPGDEQAAKEATDYIPHLLLRENEGYIWFYWFFKDALMYRLAWGAVDIEEKEQVKRTPISKIPADVWALMQTQIEQEAEKRDAKVEIDVKQDEAEDSQPAMSVMPQPVTFSGTITTTRKVKKIVVDNVAPEDGLVSPMSRHIDEASFCGYRKKVTASDLRVLGLDQDTIDNLASDDIYTIEEAQRQPNVIQASTERDDRDDSERTLWVVVAFVKFDWDDDGISEMRRVVYAHAGGSVSAIIENEEWTDGVAPIIPGSPILMSHTIPGRDLFDLVRDIQDIGTAVTRGMLDNTYMVNRPRAAVSDAVDLASLIDWTPGMPIRMRQGQKVTPEDLQWLTPTPIMDKALLVLQWKDQIQQKRTGVTPNNQGQPDENMNPTATGASLLTSAADSRIELISQTFAETSIKRLFRLLYRAVKRVAVEPIKYWDGQSFATIDPTKWPDDMSLQVDVGNKASNRVQQMQALGTIAAGQEKLWAAQGNQAGPALGLQHLANTLRKGVEIVGFKNSDQFINPDPQIQQEVAQKAQQPPPPNPEMAKVQAQSQAKMAEVQANAQAKQQEQQSDAQLAQQKLMADIEADRQRAAADMQIAREKAQQDMQLAREKAALEAQLKREELILEAQLKREQMRMDPDTPNSSNIQEQDTV